MVVSPTGRTLVKSSQDFTPLNQEGHSQTDTKINSFTPSKAQGEWFLFASLMAIINTHGPEIQFSS